MAGRLDSAARTQPVDLGVIDLCGSDDDEAGSLAQSKSSLQASCHPKTSTSTENPANTVHEIDDSDTEDISGPASRDRPSGESSNANVTYIVVEDEDPLSVYVSQVLEVVPDVDPDHLLALIQKHMPHYQQDGIVQAILHVLFEDPTYPKKIENKGKRKRSDEGDAANKKVRIIDYGKTDRIWEGGRHYAEMTLHQLQTDFPYVPIPHIRKVLSSMKRFYAATHLQLLSEIEDSETGRPLPYNPKKTPSAGILKGKNRILEDDEFERERAWLLRKLHERTVEKDKIAAEELATADGTGVECGCCFATYPFEMMVQCPEMHLFCRTCLVQYCETQLGSHDVSISCMDQSGCKELFPVSELRRNLPEKLMELYERLKSSKEIELAEIEGLEDCPFCDWKCTIDNPDEKLFRCGNDECGVVSCRGCKKIDHLPKSCKEVDDDRILDGKHAIEEAMTRALMRNCPKCKKAFVKEMGCNKMTCSNCGTLSCYVCREEITGYEHFERNAQASGSKKCQLYDPDTEARHAEEVKAAAEHAQTQFRKENPEVDAAKVHVDLPKAPVRQNPLVPAMAAFHYAPAPAIVAPNFGGIIHQAMNVQNVIVPMPPPPPVRRRRGGGRGRRYY